MMKNYGGKVFLAFACAMVATGCLSFERPDTGMGNQRTGRGFSLINSSNDRPLMSSRQGRIPNPTAEVNNNSYQNDNLYQVDSSYQVDNSYQNSNSYQNNNSNSHSMTVTSPNIDNVADSKVYVADPIAVAKTPVPTAPATVTAPQYVMPSATTPAPRNEPVIDRPVPTIPQAIKYTVVRGDSLWKIGRYYGVTMNTLANFNNIPLKSRLKIGQTIMLPPGAKFNPNPKPIKRVKSTIKRASTSSSSRTLKAYTPKAKMAIPANGKYVIQKGDSLWKIAHKFGISVQEIKRLNNLKTNSIRPNKTIVLRSGVSNGTVVVGKKPTAASIAAKNELKNEEDADNGNMEENTEVLSDDPNESNIEEDDDTLSFGIYSVEESDETLKSIAETCAVSEEELKALNPNVDWNNIHIGMEIKYPDPK